MASISQPAERQGRDSPPLLLTKLHPPTARNEWVDRERLLERLRPTPGTRLAAVIAPAGSGKTTLLGTWWKIEAPHRPLAWLSLDEGDNDPVVLWTHALEALRRVCSTLDAVRSPEQVGPARLLDTFLPDLINGLAEGGDTALVFDDFHRIVSRSSRESVAWLVEHAPASFQLVVSTRLEPALPLAALRAHGELIELRAEDLGFNGADAEVLLNDRLGLGLERDAVEELVERTEGWPAGLYLAALSLRGVEDRHAFVNRFDGTNRGVVDFLVDEVLEAHDPAMQTLMLRCSVLERLCGPLCDAVLERGDSASQLRGLARSNLFLLPLDDDGHWYRFHHLFGTLLRAELEYREPGLAPTLHRRAYEWHRDQGATGEAIVHALDAGAFAEAEDLISASWIRYFNACRVATVLGWLERFPAPVLEASAALMFVKAWMLGMSAKREEALEAIAAIEQMDGLDHGPLPGRASSIAAFIATMRACFQWGDVGSGYQNAVLATELQEPHGPFWAAASWARGMGHFYRGQFAEADPWFAEAARLAPTVEMWIVAASAIAYRSLIAGEHGDLEQQRLLAEEAAQLSRERRLEEIDGEVAVALGASLAARDQFEKARSLCEQGVVVLRAYGQPMDVAYALIRQAPVLRALGEVEAAAAAIAEARATVDSCADPGKLDDWLAALEKQPRERSRGKDDELSERELSVLRALTGPLSERDIARELYLSHNTIHSHTRSIYRKLGVSSRAEAIQQGRALGLI